MLYAITKTTLQQLMRYNVIYLQFYSNLSLYKIFRNCLEVLRVEHTECMTFKIL